MGLTLQQHLSPLPPGDFLPVSLPPLPLHDVHLYALCLPTSINVSKCNRIPSTVFTQKISQESFPSTLSENGSHLIIALDIKPWCTQSVESFNTEWPLG